MISQMMITISRSGQGTIDELGEHSPDLKMNCDLYALQTLQTLQLMDLLHKYVRYRYLLHVRSEKQAHWLCSSGLSHTSCYLYVNYMAVICRSLYQTDDKSTCSMDRSKLVAEMTQTR